MRGIQTGNEVKAYLQVTHDLENPKAFTKEPTE